MVILVKFVSILRMADRELPSSHTETVQSTGEKRKYPSDEHEKRKARLEKWKKAKNTRKGKLEFSFCHDEENDELFAKVKAAKSIIVTTFQLLHRALDFYLCHNDNVGPAQSKRTKDSSQQNAPKPSEFQQIDEEKTVDENVFVGSVSSLQNLVDQIQYHSEICTHNVTIGKQNRIRHVIQTELQCKGGHKFRWTSSPHVAGGKYLVNLRLAHGYLSSGILPNQLSRLCEAANIGVMGTSYIDELV